MRRLPRCGHLPRHYALRDCNGAPLFFLPAFNVAVFITVHLKFLFLRGFRGWRCLWFRERLWLWLGLWFWRWLRHRGRRALHAVDGAEGLLGDVQFPLLEERLHGALLLWGRERGGGRPRWRGAG